MSEALARKLVALCEADGIAANRLAIDTGIPQSTIAAIIKKHSRAREDTLVTLADYFGISVDELIDHRVKPREKPLVVRQQSVTITLSPEKAEALEKILDEWINSNSASQ